MAGGLQLIEAWQQEHLGEEGGADDVGIAGAIQHAVQHIRAGSHNQLRAEICAHWRKEHGANQATIPS